jgi:uncharacterized protein (DUF697 family)
VTPEDKNTGKEQPKVTIKRPRRRLYEADTSSAPPEPPPPPPAKPKKKPKTPAPTPPSQSSQPKDVETSGAGHIIKKNMYWSMGIALLPFPLFDTAALIALQVKMARDISKLYGIPFSENRGKAIILALLGGLNVFTLSSITFRGFLKLLPGAGYLLGAASASAFAAATTYAIGKVFVQHYEMGGTLLDMDPDDVKDYFRQQYQKGLKKNK